MLVSFGIGTIGSCLISLKIVYIRDLATKCERIQGNSIESRTKFEDVWMNKNYLEAFADHCVREYSRYTEPQYIALCFIYVRYQSLIFDDLIPYQLVLMKKMQTNNAQ